MKRTLVVVFIILSLYAYTAEVTIPFTFTSGTKASAVEMNANFTALKTALESALTRIEALEAKLANVTVSGTDVIFSGVNVHIRDGKGTTDGVVNGLGNLFIGYNEARFISNGDPEDTLATDRTGSHNIVIGKLHHYTSYACFIAGQQNTVSGAYSSVTGGKINRAFKEGSIVSGGFDCAANGDFSSVLGGLGCQTDGLNATIGGGRANLASGAYSSVSGGRRNTASGESSSILGGGGVDSGDSNKATGTYSTVTGGTALTASGQNEIQP